MIAKLRESRVWQLLFIATLILLIPLTADISGRMAILRRMHQERARLEQELAMAGAEYDALKARLEFVKGDAYLEQWARVEARMALPGEVAIIPLFAEKKQRGFTALDGRPFLSATRDSVSEHWRRLFFDHTTTP